MRKRPEQCRALHVSDFGGTRERHFLSLVGPNKLRRILNRMLDEDEFLSPYGLRSLSKAHEHDPVRLDFHGEMLEVRYQPGDSDTWLFGGNSNWRGPIWFPLNYLMIESLQKFHHYLGDEFKVEYPTGLRQRAEPARGGHRAVPPAHPRVHARRETAAGR